MAGTKEIKDRIESVRDTQKITNAMYLIASTKLRKARAELDRTRPYSPIPPLLSGASKYHRQCAPQVHARHFTQPRFF